MIFNYFLFLITASCTTFFSFRSICKNWKYSVAGTFLLVLSQYYLVNMTQCPDSKENWAYIFIPILYVGIYDFLTEEGRKVYLIGIALVGLLLLNVPLALLGGCVAMGFLVLPLFLKKVRQAPLSLKKLCRLGITVLLTGVVALCYIFPRFGQIFGSTANPVSVGDHTQAFANFFLVKGSMKETTEIGIGIPVLMLMVCRFLYGKMKNKWADIFCYVGMLMVLATTDLFPWRLLNHTFLNVIQYTHRVYPYALCTLILGILLVLSEKCVERAGKICAFIVALSIFFGAWQMMPVS